MYIYVLLLVSYIYNISSCLHFLEIPTIDAPLWFLHLLSAALASPLHLIFFATFQSTSFLYAWQAAYAILLMTNSPLAPLGLAYPSLTFDNMVNSISISHSFTASHASPSAAAERGSCVSSIFSMIHHALTLAMAN